MYPRLCCFVALAVAWPAAARAAKPEALTPVPFQDVHINDDYWGPRLRTVRTATVEANLRQCELTGRIKNFAVAGKLVEGKYQGELYNDSDVYKVIEGVAYVLPANPNPDLAKPPDPAIHHIPAPPH